MQLKVNDSNTVVITDDSQDTKSDITALDDNLRTTVVENVNIDQIAKQQGLYNIRT